MLCHSFIVVLYKYHYAWFPDYWQIYLRLGLGVDKDRTDAVNWYRGVLQLLMIYELGKSPLMVPFQWEHVSEAWCVRSPFRFLPFLLYLTCR